MSEQRPLVFLSCGVFKGITEPLRDAKLETVFLDPGLHATPKVLNTVVQEQIDAILEPSVIVLGYGLCGNGLHNIQAGKHILMIPKMDDCIAMFMGSRTIYMGEFAANPGTYYLTKGWLQAGSHPLAEYERYLERFGETTADYLMDQQYQHYKRLIFVAHKQVDLDNYRPLALEIAAFCERWHMEFEEYLGEIGFIGELEDIVRNPAQVPDTFIVVNPGETLIQGMFR